MVLTKNDKFLLLLETLKQRYSEVDEMRKSAFQIVTWTIGGFLLLAGWIVQRTQPLDILQKTLLALVICFPSGILMWFLKDMEGGFRRRLEVIYKIQSILGLYQVGYFQPGESLLMTQKQKGGFFRFIQIILLLASVIVIVIIFLSGVVF